MEVISNHEKDTAKIAAKIAEKVGNGGLILLNGDLGTGKTFIAKHILAALGISIQKAKSPTYTYIHHHKIKQKNIYHLDLYRIEQEDLLLEEEVDEIISNSENITIIEWANRIHKLPQHKTTINIDIEYLSPNSRRLTINGNS